MEESETIQNEYVPSLPDILQISNYAKKIIDSLPSDIKKISIFGDIIYSFFRMHPELDILNDDVSYETICEYGEEIDNIYDLSGSAIEIQPQIDIHNKMKRYCNDFCNFWESYWNDNYHQIIPGFIYINLSRFTYLESLYLVNIYTYKIEKIPNCVYNLLCRSCEIRLLDELPEELVILNCNGNCLYRIPPLNHTKLKSLFCCSNYLTILPRLPKTIEWLYCYNNSIGKLPTLPPLIEYLSCSNNEIRVLPKLPENIRGVYIDSNYLRELPETLPKSLQIMFCNNNRIRRLPELPPFLKRFSCYNNPIVEYSLFPPSLVYLNTDGNAMILE